MDPNATLATLREIVSLARTNSADPAGLISDLVETFPALDEWLSSGGFLPADWSR